MKDFVCLYSVEALDLNEKTKTYYGFLFVDNFTDAVSQLEDSIFGSDLMEINKIQLFDTTPQISEETFKMLEKDLNTY